MRILQHIIEGIGTRLYAFDLQPILQVILKSVDHMNRFVREISYLVVNAIFETSKGVLDQEQPEENITERFKDFCDKLAPIVAQGLSDNWSQVRYAAGLSVRSLYYVIKDDK